MMKILLAVAALPLLIPLAFLVLLGGPQASTEAAGVVTACRLVLGMAPQPETTVEQLGGSEAAGVAAALTSPPLSNDPAATTPPATTTPVEQVAPLLGEKAYAFVTTLNILENWRTLPPAAAARWAMDPQSTAPPEGAQRLPDLPAAQTTAVTVTEQPDTAYGRGCAAVIGRATAISVDPAGARPGPVAAPTAATLAQMEGTTMRNLDLLRAVNPDASKDDPRQFYLDYRPVASPGVGDIVVYDFTIAGPVHFGIALDSSQMLTTASFAGGTVAARSIPRNSAAMSAVAAGTRPTGKAAA